LELCFVPTRIVSEMPYFQPKLVLPSSLPFHGKYILITGASAGLGLAATRLLLIHGAREIIAGVRSVSKAEAVKSKILSDPEVKKANPYASITVLRVDLEDYESVLEFAKEVKQRYDGKLDMVLLNAGTGSLKWEIAAKSGHEKTIQVNLLSPALMVLELPALEKTATIKGVPSRITWVGSFVQFDHSLSKKPIQDVEKVLGHFDDEKNFVSMGRYSDSKLLGTMFIEQLARYVDPANVIVNDVSPGMVRTGFGEYPIWLRGMFAVFFGLKARTADEGAKTYLHALGVAGKESHGQYLSDNQITE
jgi:NAD(P)-dependent dehydrogenase (short-subunit alcohol dehydrogenase family)